jgi:hypothetical protein
MNTIPKINKGIQEQEIELINNKKFIFMVCGKCGWSGIASTFHKWIQSSNGELRERKRYSKPKCPFCR